MNYQNQQWIVVGKNKRKDKNKKTYQQKIVWANGPTYQIQKTQIDQQLFINSKSYLNNCQIIKKLIVKLNNQNTFQDHSIYVQCLGIGNFIKSFKPRYQYYFLKNLLITLIKTLFPQKKLFLNVYDPIFDQECIDQIQKLGATSQKRQNINYKGMTIYFMPHCQRFLYQNIIKNNKTCSLVIGNSIREYIDRCKLISQKVPLVFKQIKTQQIKLIDYKESLNDTYIYII